jgi:hypothetical protein
MRSSSTLIRIIVVITFLGLLVVLTIANHRFAIQAPGGNDFLARWTGAHYWLVEGVNPYDEKVSLAAQTLIYGREAIPELGEDVAHFVYPLPAMIFFAPFGLLPYTLARALWMTILELCLPVLAYLGIQISNWKPDRATAAFLLLFSVFWYHGIRSIVVGQFAVIEAVLIIGALAAIRVRNDILAGILLGLSIAKPQMAILIIPFILFWGISSRRWKLVWATMGTFAALLAGSLLIMPDWPLRWLQQLAAYPDYTALGSPVSIATSPLGTGGRILEWVLNGGLLVYLLVEWMAARRRSGAWVQWTAAMTLVVTNLVALRTATTNYVVLLPALVVIFASLDSRWRKGGLIAVWGIMLSLLIGLWGLFLTSVEGNIESAWMYFPLPLITFIGLLWTRWWVVRGVQLPIGERFA